MKIQWKIRRQEKLLMKFTHTYRRLLKMRLMSNFFYFHFRGWHLISGQDSPRMRVLPARGAGPLPIGGCRFLWLLNVWRARCSLRLHVRACPARERSQRGAVKSEKKLLPQFFLIFFVHFLISHHTTPLPARLGLCGRAELTSRASMSHVATTTTTTTTWHEAQGSTAATRQLLQL